MAGVCVRERACVFMFPGPLQMTPADKGDSFESVALVPRLML